MCISFDFDDFKSFTFTGCLLLIKYNLMFTLMEEIKSDYLSHCRGLGSRMCSVFGFHFF